MHPRDPDRVGQRARATSRPVDARAGRIADKLGGVRAVIRRFRANPLAPREPFPLRPRRVQPRRLLWIPGSLLFALLTRQILGLDPVRVMLDETTIKAENIPPYHPPPIPRKPGQFRGENTASGPNDRLCRWIPRGVGGSLREPDQACGYSGLCSQPSQEQEEARVLRGGLDSHDARRGRESERSRLRKLFSPQGLSETDPASWLWLDNLIFCYGLELRPRSLGGGPTSAGGPGEATIQVRVSRDGGWVTLPDPPVIDVGGSLGQYYVQPSLQ